MANAFEHIKQGKERIREQKQEASLKTETLNPRGLGGPVFDEMKQLFDTLGISEERETLGSLRQIYEARLRRKVLDIYNKYLVGKKGSPTHHNFSNEIEKKFLYGFDLYLKTFLRLDARQAPQPFETYMARTMGGSGNMKIVDEESEVDYMRKYIESGKDVKLDKTDEKHKFDRSQAMDGYGVTYQNVIPDDAQKGAMASYMFEKFRAYEDDFFNNLNIALEQGVDLNRAIDFSTYSYGVDGKVFAEMSEFDFEPNEIAAYAIQNRTKAEFVFSTYKRIGKDLEDKYRYVDESGKYHSWVPGPKAMRHFIFKYPDTIEAGVLVVDKELSRLKQIYKDIPERILIEKCLEFPDDFENKISEFQAEYIAISSTFTVPSSWISEYQGSESVFEFYKVSAEAMISYFRANNKKTLDDAIKNTEYVHEKFRERADEDGVTVPNYVTRKILRSFLLHNMSRSRVLEEVKRFYQRELERRDRIYSVAYDLFRDASEEEIRYFVELGFGASPNEIIENGKAVYDLLVADKNPNEAELFIEECIELYYRYLDAGFPQDSESLIALKDALAMNPFDPKQSFEMFLKRNWPEPIPILKPSLDDID